MSRIGPLVCPILVGRDDVLELVDRSLVDVADGRGRMLLVSGDPGLGKSRLLGSIERRASSVGFRVVSGYLAPQDRAVPGAILKDLARSLRRVPEMASASSEIVERLDNPDLDSPLASARRRRQLVLDLVDVIVERCTTPTMLAFEDLHWADDLSLEVISTLARRLDSAPVLLVATMRPTESEEGSVLREWRAGLLTHRLADEVRLGSLGRADTATMVEVLRGEHVPAAVVTAVHERTDGIPLHVEELLGVLAEHGPWTAEDVRSARVPDTIEATILERLRGRSGDAQTVAAIGAVIGRRFIPSVVERIAGWPADRLADSLSELAAHAFLDVLATGELDFRNQLVRDAIYAATPIADRRRLHALVADQSERLDRASEIHASAHFELAGRREDAHRTALRAARAAAAMSAHREALELFRRAIRMVPDVIPTPELAQIRCELAVEEAARDDPQAAAASLALARLAFLSSDDQLAAADVVARLAGVRHLAGDGLTAVRPMVDDALAAIASVEGRRADGVRARLLAALAAAHGRALDLPATERYAAAAIELATASGDIVTEINALGSLAMIWPFAARAADAEVAGRAMIARAHEHRLDDEAARAYRVIGSSLSEVHELEAAERWLRDGIAFADRSELWNHRCYMTAHIGLVYWATGRWAEADATALAALDEGRGGLTTRVTGLYVRGFVAMGRGQLDEATLMLNESLSLGEPSGDILRISLPLWGLAEAAGLAGRVDDAIELTERGRLVSRAVDDAALLSPMLVTGTRCRLAGRDAREARRWFDDVGGVVRSSGIASLQPAVDHAAGLIALTAGSTVEARALLDDAVRGWDRVRRSWEATRARLDLADCLLRGRRVQEAAAVIADARAMAESLESRPLMARAIELMASARSRRQFGDRWAPLTAREFEVARLVATGCTNGEIAAELVITPKTVASHVEHILNKLGATRRAEIAAWAARVGDSIGSA